MLYHRYGTRALTILVAATMFCGLLSLLIPNEHMFASAGQIPSTLGDQSISTKIRYDGGNCVITGSIYVYSGGNLILNNLTLAIDNQYDGEYGIYLYNGGVLRIFNSTIKSNTGSQSENFYSEGMLQIENSTIRDFGPNGWWAGVYLQSGNPILKNDTFANNNYGVMLEGAIPTIMDCTFKDTGFTGLLIDSGSPTLYNVVFTGNGGYGWGGGAFYMESGGTITFYNATITNNLEDGAYIAYSTAIFYNSSLSNNNNADIHVADWGSNAEADLYDSTFGTKNIENWGGTTKLVVYWFANLTAYWQSDNSSAAGGTYTVFDNKGAQVVSDTLNGQGKVLWLPIKEYEDTGGGKKLFTPYAFNVTATRGFITRSNVTSADVTKNTNVSFMLDDVPPILKITSPKEGLATRNLTVDLAGVTEPKAKVWLAGGLVTIDQNGGFALTVDLKVEGKNNIKLQVFDKVGNERDAEVNVTRDTIAPVLTIDAPAEGDLFNYSAIKVTGTTEPGAVLKVDGNPLTLTGAGNYQTTLNLKEGVDLINVTTRDAVGNSRWRNVNVTIDLTPPNLKISEPLEGFKTKDSAIRLTGSTEPKAAVTVNGLPAPLSGTVFQMTVNMAEGKTTITVKSCDKAMNCVSRTVNGSRHSGPPSLQVTAPPSVDTVLTNKDTYQINGTTDPGVVLTINSKAVNVGTDGSFTVMEPLREGDTVFTIIAVDAYGNMAQLSRKVQRDSVPPMLEVTSPQTGFRTKDKQVEISGDTEASAILTINGNKVSFTGSVFTKTVALDKEGENDFTVMAMDKAGNFNVVQLKVVRKTQVMLKLTTPLNGTRTKNETVSIEGMTEPNAHVEINDFVIAAKGTGAFKATVNLTIGDNTISVKAVDDLGNQASGNILVVREKKTEPPKPPPIGPGTSGNGLLLPLILVVVVIAAIGGSVGFFMMKRKKKGDQAPPAQQPPVAPPQPPVQTQPPPQGNGGYNQYGGGPNLVPPPSPPPVQQQTVQPPPQQQGYGGYYQYQGGPNLVPPPSPPPPPYYPGR